MDGDILEHVISCNESICANRFANITVECNECGEEITEKHYVVLACSHHVPGLVALCDYCADRLRGNHPALDRMLTRLDKSSGAVSSILGIKYRYRQTVKDFLRKVSHG